MVKSCQDPKIDEETKPRITQNPFSGKTRKISQIQRVKLKKHDEI